MATEHEAAAGPTAAVSRCHAFSLDQSMPTGGPNPASLAAEEEGSGDGFVECRAYARMHSNSSNNDDDDDNLKASIRLGRRA